jgi:hypothetical protein
MVIYYRYNGSLIDSMERGSGKSGVCTRMCGICRVVTVGPWVFYVLAFKVWKISTVVLFVVSDEQYCSVSLRPCFHCMALCCALQ